VSDSDAEQPPRPIAGSGTSLNPVTDAEEIREQAQELLPEPDALLSNDHSAVAEGALRSTLFRSVGWVAVGKWGNRLLSLAVFALLGRLLSPTQFGLAALSAVFITLFTLLAEQGFSSALIQKANVTQEDCDTAFWVSVATAIGFTVLIILLAPLIGQALHQPELTPVLRVLSPAMILSALAGTQEALLERDFAFRSLSIRTLFGSVIGGTAGVVVAALGGGVWSLVVQALLTSAVQVVVLWTITPWRPGLAVNRASLHALRAVGISVLGIEMFGFLSAQSDKLLIGAFISSSAVGYYFVGIRIIAITIEVQTSVIESVSLTTLSKLRTNRERLLNAFYRLTGFSAAVSVLTFSLLGLLAPQIVPLLFGDQWHQSIIIMQVLCVMGALNSVIIFDRNALVAVGAGKAALFITAVQSIVGVIAVLITVHWGVLAVAIGVTVRQYLVWPLRLRALHRHVGVRISTYLLRWFGPMSSGVLACCAGFAVASLWQPGSGTTDQLVYIVVQSVLVSVIYLTTLRYTGTDSWQELKLIPSLIAKRGKHAKAEPV
jgi:O-antigen/teichoic acid export membrane protein